MTVYLRTQIGRAVALVLLLLPGHALATDYFVAPTGDDLNNPGSSLAPWRTVRKAAATVQAGDTVTIEPGTYVESPAPWLASSGLPGSPIVFTAEPGAVFQSPIAYPAASNEAFNISGASYVQLIGFEATGGFDETIFVRTGSHHIEITNCNLYGNHIGIVTSNAHDITISGCSLHDNTRGGMRLGGATHDVTVSDTQSFNNSDGRGCAGFTDGFTSDRAAYNLTFLRTTSRNNSQDGYDLPANNVVLDRVQSINDACAGLKLWSNATVTNCFVQGTLRGITTTSVTAGSTISISNCTLVDNRFGIDFHHTSVFQTPYYARLFNTIIAAPNQMMAANRAFRLDNSVVLSESRNLLWGTSLTATLIQGYGRRYTGLDVNSGRWQLQQLDSDGTLSLPPLFTDPSNGDYTPQTASAAVDRGLANATPLFDLNGSSRPQGTGPDIGAIESPIGSSNHQPLAYAGRNRLGRLNRTLSFTSSGSFDADNDPLTFSWDFGDASPPAAGPLVSHQFTQRGVYTVTLTASDGQLTSQAAFTIRIY